MRKLLLILFALAFISSVSAWTNTTFNSSLSEENLTFTGNENITRYLAIPSDVTGITEAYLNLTGRSGLITDIFLNDPYEDGDAGNNPWSGFCSSGCSRIGLAQQIEINNRKVDKLGFWIGDASTGTGDLNFSVYNSTYSKTQSKFAVDKGSIPGGATYYEVDYSTEPLLNGSYFLVVEFVNGTTTNPEYFRVFYAETAGEATGDILNNSDSYEINNSGDFVYDGPLDLLFNVTYDPLPYPSNITVSLGGQSIFNFNEVFTQSNNRTTNFYSIISSLFNSTYQVGSNYIIPFVFHSDALGVLEYLDLDFSNEEFSNLTVSSTICADPVLHFSFKDEKNLSTITTDIEYNFYYGLGDDSLRYSFGSLTAQDDFYVCINGTESTNWLLKSGEIHYRDDSYVDRVFYLYDDTIMTNGTLVEYDLYDLLTASQTSFKIEVEDTSLNPYVDKFISLLRWYPQLNEYKVVGMGKTDEKGETVAHVETEDVDYRIGVYERNGTLIKLEEPTRFVCLVNPCTYTLKISPTDDDFTSLYDVDYTFTYNTTTGIWLFTYSDSSQKTSLMNLTIFKVTGTSVFEICTDSATGYTGVLSCNTSIYSGTFRGVVYRSASPDTPLAQKIITTTQTAFSSTFGLWLSLLIGIPIAFLFALMSPIAAVLGGVIMLLPALYFGAVNWAIVGGIAVLGGIVMHFLKRIG